MISINPNPNQAVRGPDRAPTGRLYYRAAWEDCHSAQHSRIRLEGVAQ